ncbi:MAG TPA: phosphatidate cytidylyltransferase [Actinomycetota bacterium]|nr:phosphatidate cytidylyltransferase [Actinomycetota bacterium]
MKRASTALLLLAAIALAVFGGALAMLLVTMIVVVIAAGELYRLVRTADLLPAATVGLAATVALLVVGYVRAARAPESFPFVVAAALFLSFVVLLFRRNRTHVTRAVASTMIPVVCIGLPAAYAVAMRSASGGYSIAWVFVLMALTAEAGAWAVTWLVRRRSLTPRAHRTWEHLVGAFAGAAIGAIAAVAGASPPFTWARALVLAVLVAPAVSTGDLAWAIVEDDLARTEPGAKRQHPVVLSRVGGALLSAPVFFYVLRALVS